MSQASFLNEFEEVRYVLKAELGLARGPPETYHPAWHFAFLGILCTAAKCEKLRALMQPTVSILLV